MELATASSKCELTQASLSSLSVECLEHILSFHIPNGVLSLILTGDKQLMNKVSRTSRLSILWTSPGFLYWKQVSSLIKMLPKLESLSLTAWSPQVLPQGPVNTGIFSSSLRRLHLRYHGCAAMLNGMPLLFLLPKLVVLEELSIFDESKLESSIMLSRLPPTLRSLRIQSSDYLHPKTSMNFFWEDLATLPEGLETLYLHANGLHNPNDYQSIDREEPELMPLVLPSHLTSLTELTVWASPLSQSLDIPVSIAQNLKRLGYLGLDFSVDSVYVFNPKVSFKQYFPVLESLVTLRYRLSDRNQFRSLPPTLTELAVTFDDDLPSAESDSELVDTLNRECMNSDGVLLFAAPRNMRLLVEYDLPLDILRSISARRSYIYDSLDPPTGPLVELVADCAFTIAMVDMLPSRLEGLCIVTTESNVLKALVAKSNEGMLPNLKAFTLDINGLSAGEGRYDIDASTIPTTLTTLSIPVSLKGELCFSLRNHHRLLSLDVCRVDLAELLPNLPSSLQSLVATMSRPLNLANPEEALALFNMRRQLPHLKDLELSRDSSDETETNWLEHLSPLNRPNISASHWFTLPMAIKSLYARYYLNAAQFGLIWSYNSVGAAGELFAISCLPRSVCLLRLPAYPLDHMTASDTITMLKKMAFVTLKYQFPLLGLPLHDRFVPNCYDALIRAVPPSLSFFQRGDSNMSKIAESLGRIATGYERADFMDPWKRVDEIFMEPGFHIANTVMWLLIERFGPLNWKTNWPLRGYMLSSALGSAIAAPLLLWNLSRAGVLMKDLAFKYPQTLITQTVAAAFWTSPLYLLLCFGVGSTQRGLAVRGLALAVAGAVSLGRNMGIQGSRG